MKRLLCSGSGPIYQVCKVFRDGESGRFHNPEFTLLEWYRPGMDHHQLMDEVAALIEVLMPEVGEELRISYRELFLKHLSIDPLAASEAELRDTAVAQGVAGANQLQLDSKDAWLDLLLTHCIEPRMATGLCFVYDYPPSQASLAQIRAGESPVAERFELYVNGMEMANGFHELADAVEQRQRFEKDMEKRDQLGLPSAPLDTRFLAALENGLPPCAGVALGIDRLLMQIANVDHINDVLAFPLERA